MIKTGQAERYWEARWRDEAAENDRLRASLKEIAGNTYEGVKGRGFCHPEGCESPSIAQAALRCGKSHD